MDREDPLGVGLSPNVEVRVEGGARISLTFRLSVFHGRLEPWEIRVSARRPLTTEMMRGIRWGAAIEQAKRQYLRVASRAAAGGFSEVYERLFPEAPESTRKAASDRLVAQARLVLPAAEASAGRPGRPAQYGPEHFEEVARIYSEAYAVGEHPTRAVAEKFVVSRSAAAKWVRRARLRGLLPETEQRVAKGRTAATKQRRRRKR